MFRKTTSLRIMINAVLLGVAAFYLNGCIPLVVGAAAGAGSIIWAKGALQEDLKKPLDRVYNATKTALKEMELPIQVDKKDNLTAKVESEFVDGKHVRIDLNYISKNSSKISIRVGTLGDEIRSREISQTIMKHL